MTNIHIDESGSITTQHVNVIPYFLIALIKPNDARKLKTAYKRFVTQNFEELKKADKNNKMFVN